MILRAKIIKIDQFFTELIKKSDTVFWDTGYYCPWRILGSWTTNTDTVTASAL